MARNYSREYELAKGKTKALHVRVSPELFDEFKGKCDDEGCSMNAFLKTCMTAFIDNDIAFDGESIKAQK